MSNSESLLLFFFI